MFSGIGTNSVVGNAGAYGGSGDGGDGGAAGCADACTRPSIMWLLRKFTDNTMERVLLMLACPELDIYKYICMHVCTYETVANAESI